MTVDISAAQGSLRKRLDHEKRVKANNARAAEFNRAVRVANVRINIQHRRP